MLPPNAHVPSVYVLILIHSEALEVGPEGGRGVSSVSERCGSPCRSCFPAQPRSCPIQRCFATALRTDCCRPNTTTQVIGCSGSPPQRRASPFAHNHGVNELDWTVVCRCGRNMNSRGRCGQSKPVRTLRQRRRNERVLFLPKYLSSFDHKGFVGKFSLYL